MTKLKVTEPTSLARPSQRVEPWHNVDWQQLWLASQQSEQRTWRTLALLPAGPGATPEEMLQIAVSLAHTGMTHLGMPIHVADGTRVTLAQLMQFKEELNYYTERAGMVVIALSALSENVTSLSLAQSADQALLCVLLKRMTMASGKQTVERIGAKHFIGSAVFR